MRRLLPILCMLIFVSAFDQVMAQDDINIYGYFSTRFEKVWGEPGLDGTKTVKEDAPGEFGYPYLNIMFQQAIGEDFRVYINLNGGDAEGIDVRNFWGEYSMNQLLNVRVGKIYRKFGLYNEILDATPTYYGIEPPELFDGDHLMLSRLTTFMIYGGLNLGPGTVNYSVSTDNGEGGPFESVIPVGYDLNYNMAGDFDVLVGTSGFMSGENAKCDKGVGEGSPGNGVLPWMENDDFSVMGGYLQITWEGLTLQGAYWMAAHTAERNAADVLTVIKEASVNDAQRARFLKDPNGAEDEDNVNLVGDYDVSTYFIRAGYSIETDFGEFAPYGQWDFYSNPETIGKKKYGGDNEAGVADDGEFLKWTAGIIYRPIDQVAFKFDTSSHLYKFNGADESYPEIRIDLAYTFGL